MESGKILFGTHGYGGVRVADITRKAGLSSGAFYRYFEDRHELLLVLLEEMLDELYAFARARWDAENPALSVQVTTERYFEFYRDNAALLGVMVELAQTDPEVREIWRRSRRAFYTRIAKALARGKDAGVVREDLDFELAAEFLGSMTEFYAFQRYALLGDAIKDVSLEDAAHVLTDIWTRGTAAGERAHGATAAAGQRTSPSGSEADEEKVT